MKVNFTNSFEGTVLSASGGVKAPGQLSKFY
jgi:hypothetical protein